MTAPVGDPIATPVALAVLATVLEEYDERDDVDGPCVASLVSGVSAPVDHCDRKGQECHGQLWVRVMDTYPSVQFPAPDQTVLPDGPSAWAVQLEIGVVRAAPDGTTHAGEYQPPSADDEQAAAVLQLLDAHVLRQALLCRYPADNDDVGVLLGNYLPYGPDGPCVGGAVICTVQVLS